MVLNSFIIQMNGNHVDASGRGCASVSELASQLLRELMKVAPRRGGGSQPRGGRLIPFEVQTSEGGLVRCQLTFFI